MEEYWGATKENIIEKLGKPHETKNNEHSGLEELTYVFPPKADFQPQKEVTYGFHNNSLVIISTGYDFNEGLFKQYELYHKSLEDNWNKRLETEPVKNTKDEEGNIVTIWKANNSEIVLFFNNNPESPDLVVIQNYKPSD